MINVFSISDKQFLIPINNKEKDLQNLLVENWKSIFPHLTFIKAEFELEGKVRSKDDKSGRIDILAFNPQTKCFVVIELKRDYSKTILQQAYHYTEFIEDNFDRIYLHATENFDITLPKSIEIDKGKIEMILIAKGFTDTDIGKAKNDKSQNLITLIQYEILNNYNNLIESSFLVTSYINNSSEDLRNSFILENTDYQQFINIANNLDNKIFDETKIYDLNYVKHLDSLDEIGKKIRDKYYEHQKRLVDYVESYIQTYNTIYQVNYLNFSFNDLEEMLNYFRNDYRLKELAKFIKLLSHFSDVDIELIKFRGENCLKLFFKKRIWYIRFYTRYEEFDFFIDIRGLKNEDFLQSYFYARDIDNDSKDKVFKIIENPTNYYQISFLSIGDDRFMIFLFTIWNILKE